MQHDEIRQCITDDRTKEIQTTHVADLDKDSEMTMEIQTTRTMDLEFDPENTNKTTHPQTHPNTQYMTHYLIRIQKDDE